jgi:large subunit ribosomal protein L9
MKIILKQDEPKLGSAGDVVTVKDGYARNYLIPRGIAVVADKSNLNILQQDLNALELKKNKDKRIAEKFADKLASASITAKVKAGEEDKIFGSVTTQDIAELLKEKGFDIDRKKIELAEPIKELGVFQIPLRLHQDVEAKIKLWVIKED